MAKQVYISADYSVDSGDRNVVDELNRWGTDLLHKTDFIDMSRVSKGSVANDPDCRPCDLKAEFNRQINASSAVIIVVGDKTATRKAGSSCSRLGNGRYSSFCTPYKQNTNGTKLCKVNTVFDTGPDDNFGNINSLSYLQHEFEQARKRNKKIIVLYNSLRNEPSWLPSYLKTYKDVAQPFWIKNYYGQKVGNYDYIKKELGFA